MRAVTAIWSMAVLATAACAPAPPVESPAPAPPPPSTPPAPTLPPAPWSGARLPAASVPAAYLAEWRKAPNRARCALLAPASTGEAGRGATARAATFSGGWAVAYDLPGLRSAFGVAGTGSEAGAPGTYSGWPHWRRWADGSSAGYGPEGGSGENQLAYLTVAGQGCLYNVWSRVGRAHLELLLDQLRHVDTP